MGLILRCVIAEAGLVPTEELETGLVPWLEAGRDIPKWEVCLLSMSEELGTRLGSRVVSVAERRECEEEEVLMLRTLDLETVEEEDEVLPRAIPPLFRLASRST